MKPKVFDSINNQIGILENATQIGYRKKFNDLWTASFKLPARDPKNTLCQIMNVVEIFDGNLSVGKYRIIGSSMTSMTEYGAFIEYQCEHVVAFLMGDFIYSQYYQRSMTPPQVLNSLLTNMQSDIASDDSRKRWVLGECDFSTLTYRMSYSFTEMNLLESVFSVPKMIVSVPWQFVYDTDVFPWVLALKQIDSNVNCEIRRGRNLVNIKREVDGSKLCNRMYVLGENGGGVGPIVDQDSIDQYGIATSKVTIKNTGDTDSLRAAGQQALEAYSQPIITYAAEAVDLWKETGREYDRFDEGKVVRIVDPVVNVDIAARIIEVYKPDIDGDPLRVELTISNIGNRYWSLYER